MLSKTNINMNFQTFSHNIPLLRKESFFFLPVVQPYDCIISFNAFIVFLFVILSHVPDVNFTFLKLFFSFEFDLVKASSFVL